MNPKSILQNFYAIQEPLREGNETIPVSTAWYKLVVNDDIDFLALHDIIDQIIARRKTEVGFREGVYRIKFVIENPNLLSRALSTGLLTIIIHGAVVNHFNEIMEQYDAIALGDTTFSIQIVKISNGGRLTKIINLTEDVRTKRSILQINNANDVLCGPPAVIAALTYKTNIILIRELSKMTSQT
jgi:hypothetical protein